MHGSKFPIVYRFTSLAVPAASRRLRCNDRYKGGV